MLDQIKPEDYREGAKALDPEKVVGLYYLENGMILAGISPKSGSKKSAKGDLRLMFPLQLQHVRLPQGDRLIFTPILGASSMFEMRPAGITGTSKIGAHLVESYVNAATVEFLLKQEAVDRLAAESRAKFEAEQAAELAAIEEEQKRLKALEDVAAGETPVGGESKEPCAAPDCCPQTEA